MPCRRCEFEKDRLGTWTLRTSHSGSCPQPLENIPGLRPEVVQGLGVADEAVHEHGRESDRVEHQDKQHPDHGDIAAGVVEDSLRIGAAPDDRRPVGRIGDLQGLQAEAQEQDQDGVDQDAGLDPPQLVEAFLGDCQDADQPDQPHAGPRAGMGNFEMHRDDQPEGQDDEREIGGRGRSGLHSAPFVAPGPLAGARLDGWVEPEGDHQVRTGAQSTSARWPASQYRMHRKPLANHMRGGEDEIQEVMAARSG